MMPDVDKNPRQLVIVLGDQLDRHAAVFDGFEPELDAVWMAEVNQEATHVWSHKLRIAGFFAAMRHFRDRLCADGLDVHYTELPRRVSDDRGKDHAELLRQDVRRLSPDKLMVTQPGDYRVLESLLRVAESLGIELEVCSDRHFLLTPAEFGEWSAGRKELLLEHFYRWMRRRHDVLIDARGEPAGGEWNYDKQNRQTFGKQGPAGIAPPPSFNLDKVTREVLELVEDRYGEHPGALGQFNLPVTEHRAQRLLSEFIDQHLPDFGGYQDAMWSGEPFLHHSLLSFALNLKLIDPRDCIAAAVDAYESGAAPLNSVEGFVRQILGWREFVRGVYWQFMPEYADRNALRCGTTDVPGFYWNGETDMQCLRDTMRAVIDHGYSHHIQRLMVAGLFAQLYGVHPRKFHEWHMAMYVDAIDWVSLPNALGMSQYGDGGILGSKPYCASGRYIDRMSNYCRNCRYNPAEAVGERACPFTTLYWDFLARHRRQFEGNRRMAFQYKNLERKPADEVRAIRRRARRLRENLN